MKLKVLIVQNNAILGNQKATFDNIESMLSAYEGEFFDLIVLPEVFAIGWDCEQFRTSAESIANSSTIDFLKNIALTFKSVVIGGTFISCSTENVLKNSCPVIDKNGNLIAIYDKTHLFSQEDSKEDLYVSSGNELVILNLGVTKIGLSVCYDIRFPELYRFYSQKGVEVFVNVAAWSKSKPEHWKIMHKARAIENQCYMIVANQTGKIANIDENLGCSSIINPWGETIACLESEEACLVMTVDLDLVKTFRNKLPLLKDRKDSGFYKFNYKEIKVEV